MDIVEKKNEYLRLLFEYNIIKYFFLEILNYM